MSLLSADITVEGFAFPLSCRAEIAGLDSLRMQLWGLWGMPVGQLRLTPWQVQYYDAFRNVVVEGQPRPEAFARIVGIPLPYTLLLALLRQRPPVPDVPARIAWDAERRLVSVADSLGNQLSFRLPGWELVAYEYAASPTVFRVTFTDWRRGSAAYAESLRLDAPQGSLRIRVREFTQQQTPSGPFALKVPDDAVRIPLE